MVHFMIYLLETGLCLSLLYLAYWLFLRKETYFNFNRLFLVGSLALALTVPLLHVNLRIPQGSSLENPARSITKFRSSYEEMIRMIDADFGTEPGARHGAGITSRGSRGVDEGGVIPVSESHGVNSLAVDEESFSANKNSAFSWTRILLIIYIGGVLYFFTRFLYLVIRLYLLAKRNRVTRQEGFRMVEIEEDISPFSFFRFLFINNGSFNESELHHVLEHEKAHIRQKHSMDHLFAHSLAVFQWFNPFAWQMRKALKTTHEYIADWQVIERGIELFDYQALLLKQVIGYHSVELVNNFNLKPIKKRITMMNKSRSGVPAKLKAILVAPIAIIIFLLFADFTLRGSGKAAPEAGPDLSGLWIKQTKDNFSTTLYIQGERFSYAEETEISDYYMLIENQELILSERPGSDGVRLKFKSEHDLLTIWWNDAQASKYKRSKSENTLDHLLAAQDMKLQLPYISQYRLMDEERVFRLFYGKDPGGGTKLTFNDKPLNLTDLGALVEKEKSRLSKLEQGSLTAVFLVDQGIPMVLVNQVREELRKIGALHIAEGGYPQGDLDLSPLLYHSVALPRLLPPPGAKKLDKKELEKVGGLIYTINLSERNSSPGEVDEGIRHFIKNSGNGKYVISLEYDGAIPYGQYVETVDMVWNVVYSFRNELAQEKYSIPYEKLGDDLQREIRKAYPMALSETLN